MFKNKRAITPLATTLLLVILAVAIGSVMMNYGQPSTGHGEEVTVTDVQQNTLLDELNQKFIDGKITAEQYEEMKLVLFEDES